jgi:uncharacterized membrane protein SirB2
LPFDGESAASRFHVNPLLQQTHANADDHRGAGTRAAGQRFASITLPHPQLDHITRHHLHEADVDAAHKTRVLLDARASGGDGSVLGIVDQLHRMRIAHRQHGNVHVHFTVEAPEIDVTHPVGFKPWGIKRHTGQIEHRPIHVDRHPAVVLHVQLEHVVHRLDLDARSLGQAVLAHEAHKAARTVTAMLHLITAGTVEDAVAEINARRGGCLHHQDLVRTHTKAPITKALKLFTRKIQRCARGIQHDEVIAGAVHFGEGQSHRGIIDAMLSTCASSCTEATTMPTSVIDDNAREASMITHEELDNAVTAGVLNRDTAQSLRDYVANSRASPVADEERFRLVASFNDVFVAIACGIVLIATTAMMGIGDRSSWIAAGLTLSMVAWGLAEVFVRKRRMALPSIMLTIAFFAGFYIVAASTRSGGHPGLAWLITGAAVMASWVHWRRFHVPITMAVAAFIVMRAVTDKAAALDLPSIGQRGFGQSFGFSSASMLGCGLVVFALALLIDASDTERRTHRADVAFWLHILAAPLMIHPIFMSLAYKWMQAAVLVILPIYVLLACLSLVIDRRALMVSALGYVLISLMNALGRESVGVMPMVALVVGMALLLLSIYWSQARAAMLGLMPSIIRRYVPETATAPTSTH